MRAFFNQTIFLVFFAISAAICIETVSAETREQKLDSQSSQVNFTLNSESLKLSGTFNNYNGKLHFNAEDFTKSKVSAKIDLSDVSVDQSTGNSFISFDSLFRALPQPIGQFTSTKITKTGLNNFNVSGIWIRGNEKQELNIPVILETSDTKTSVFRILVSGIMNESNGPLAVLGEANAKLFARLKFHTVL